MIKDNYLDISKLETNHEVMDFFTTVAKHGGVLRFVGGAVRDALKGLKGSDLNFATDLSPEEIFEVCSDEDIKTVPLGIKQGTIGVVLGDKIVEVSSLYKHKTNDKGATIVEFTDDWEEDASRRDLTINAVYADEKGNVFDYYNGINDLEKGIVRFIGTASHRVKEDYIRILRYFRFYSLFGLTEPNKKALSACQDHCSGLKTIPMERIRDELFKIIQTPNAPKVYRLMQEHNVLSYIMPDANFIDDLEYLNKLSENKTIDNEALVKLFVLYRPNAALAENLAVRLKVSRKEKQLFVALAEENTDLSLFNNEGDLKKLIYHYGKDFAKAKLLVEEAFSKTGLANLWQIYDSISTMQDLVFPLKGKDILELKLYKESQIGLILKNLEIEWVSSSFTMSKEQLLSKAESYHKLSSEDFKENYLSDRNIV